MERRWCGRMCVLTTLRMPPRVSKETRCKPSSLRKYSGCFMSSLDHQVLLVAPYEDGQGGKRLSMTRELEEPQLPFLHTMEVLHMQARHDDQYWELGTAQRLPGNGNMR
ncbi:hypothetical protein J6590_017723 [Homalodisca vitripennis]|nr:hypothetical protein J6590_017723 [Homalodisca vitripennis]